MQTPGIQNRLLQLDGVRAALALWVLFGHVSLFLGCDYPFLKNPAIAVDLFMVLSGLFIANTFDTLTQRHPYGRAVRYFWIRRVLRIWPLYVVMLTLCWLFIGQFDQWMQTIATTFPRTGTHEITPHYRVAGWQDVLLHYALLFGVNPSYATSTPLPDWSLSLEFQFYLLFPWLYLLLRRRLLWLCLIAAMIAYVCPLLFGFYTEPGHWAHFHQPAMLGYKLNLFLLGVIMNISLKAASNPEQRSPTLLAVASVMCLAVAGFLTTLGIALILYLLWYPESRLARALTLPVPRFFGEISYTIYLVHQPLLLAIAGTLAAHARFVVLPDAWRFLLVATAVLLLTTVVSWLLHAVVERPGIRLGQRLTGSRNRRIGNARVLNWPGPEQVTSGTLQDHVNS